MHKLHRKWLPFVTSPFKKSSKVSMGRAQPHGNSIRCILHLSTRLIGRFCFRYPVFLSLVSCVPCLPCCFSFGILLVGSSPCRCHGMHIIQLAMGCVNSFDSLRLCLS